MSAENTLTEAEQQLYDRQIRIWGVETQKRLGSAKVLFVGLTGVVAECMKNVVLAGIGGVTLLDDTPVGNAPPGNFLVHADAPSTLTVAQASATTLAEMNPNVKVATAAGEIADQTNEFLSSFSMVVLSSSSLAEQERVNAQCRASGVRFYGVQCAGLCGFFFADLLRHEFTEQVPGAKKEGQDAAPELRQAALDFCPLERALQAEWASLGSLRRVSKVFYALCVRREAERRHPRMQGEGLEPAVLCGIKDEILRRHGAPASTLTDDELSQYAECSVEHPAVGAIVGGFLGQEVIKVVSGKNAPMQNFYFFDIISGNGQIENIGAK